jgi:hypothetical protein
MLERITFESVAYRNDFKLVNDGAVSFDNLASVSIFLFKCHKIRCVVSNPNNQSVYVSIRSDKEGAYIMGTSLFHKVVPMSIFIERCSKLVNLIKELDGMEEINVIYASNSINCLLELESTCLA